MKTALPKLPLADALTAKTAQLCLGLEDGSADIYDLVTPTTAELLRWWFLEDICLTPTLQLSPRAAAGNFEQHRGA